MKKIILLSFISFFAINSFAEMEKTKITKDIKIKDSKVETKTYESNKKEKSTNLDKNGNKLDQNGNKLLTIDELIERYGKGEVTKNYIEVNEMYDQVEERDQRAR